LSPSPNGSGADARAGWIELYNGFAQKLGWATIRKLSSKNRARLSARLRETPDLAAWQGVFEAVSRWPWANGGEWRVTPSFMLKPDTVARAQNGEFSPPKSKTATELERFWE
jgi:hypothetical protein